MEKYLYPFLILIPVLAYLMLKKRTAKINPLGNVDYAGRIKKYTLRIQFDVHDEMAYYERGLAYLKSGDKKSALEDLEMAGSLGFGKAYEIIDRHNLIKPTSNQMYSNSLNQIKYDNSSAYLGAIKDYDKIIDSDPNNSIAYLMRGGIKDLHHDYIGAIEDITSSLKNSNKNPEAYYKRGAIKIKINDYEGASRDLKTALALGFKKADKLLMKIEDL